MLNLHRNPADLFPSFLHDHPTESCSSYVCLRSGRGTHLRKLFMSSQCQDALGSHSTWGNSPSPGATVRNHGSACCFSHPSHPPALETSFVWGKLFSGIHVPSHSANFCNAFPSLGTSAFGNKKSGSFIDRFCFSFCHRIFLGQETQR